MPHNQHDRLQFAIDVINADYGDDVSITQKNKPLNKFGRNLDVSTAFETVSEQQGTAINETFVTTNLIDSIVSSSTSDTSQSITIEGHTIDTSGNLTFAVQTIALTGRTPATLTTPLARATRAYVANSGTFGTTPTALAGTVSIYDNTGGQADGVPSVDAATKLTILAGQTQSEKCATATSQSDYWIITYMSAAIGNTAGNAALVTVRMERRDIKNGGAWRPFGRELTLWADQPGIHRDFDPCLIVPPNHDVRMVAKSDANLAEVYGEIGGYLAKVI